MNNFRPMCIAFKPATILGTNQADVRLSIVAGAHFVAALDMSRSDSYHNHSQNGLAKDIYGKTMAAIVS